MTRVARWADRSFSEIGGDRALAYFGAALAMVNALSAIHWLIGQRLSSVLGRGEVPVCWPIFPSCSDFRVLSAEAIDIAVVALLVGSLQNGLQFFHPASVKRGVYVLVFLTALKYLFILQDFRLTLNHHYMAGWVSAVYFIALNKRTTILWIIVAMYVAAGLLKIDPSAGWLSGSAFYGRLPLGVQPRFLGIACGYVVVLELFVAFGLASGRRSVFWPSFAQFLVFHFVSVTVVGWFYPVLMFMLLSALPLMRRYPRQEIRGSTGKMTDKTTVYRWQPLAWVVAFACFQAPPYLFPGASAITGEGRLFALNMFDGPLQCRAEMIRISEGEQSVTPLRPRHVNTRTMCDPIVYVEYARYICSRAGSRDSLLRLRLESQRVGDSAYSPVLDIPDVCVSTPKYTVFGHNDWISPVK